MYGKNVIKYVQGKFNSVQLIDRYLINLLYLINSFIVGKISFHDYFYIHTQHQKIIPLTWMCEGNLPFKLRVQVIFRKFVASTDEVPRLLWMDMRVWYSTSYVYVLLASSNHTAPSVCSLGVTVVITIINRLCTTIRDKLVCTS